MSMVANKKRTIKWWMLGGLVLSLLLVFSGMTACSGKKGSSIPPELAEVVLTYSMKTVDQLPTNPPVQPNSGYKFLIVSVSAENKGLESFRVGPNSFYVEADNQICDYNEATKNLDTQLKPIELRDGDKTSGDVVFAVPAASTDFSVKYIGFNVNRIRWIKQ